MIFSELYSAYYNTVAKMVKASINGTLNSAAMYEIIRENAFEESVLNIAPAVKEEKWQVITKDYKTPLKHTPTMPPTILEKQWLKAVLGDERIKLFDFSVEGLDGVEPLFTKDDYRIYDKYSDGDDYKDEGYIKRFKILLKAAREKLPVKAEMLNKNGNSIYVKFIPQKIEYSEKDDKFRVIASGAGRVKTINLARIKQCAVYEEPFKINKTPQNSRRAVVTLKITDERNALERAMLHFAHFEKRVEKTGDNEYVVAIKYDADDMSEMVIRVLSFGPLVEVLEPTSFRESIKNKLKKQLSCELK